VFVSARYDDLSSLSAYSTVFTSQYAIHNHLTMDEHRLRSLRICLLFLTTSPLLVMASPVSRRSASSTPFVVKRGYHTPDLFTIDAHKPCSTSDDCRTVFHAMTVKPEKNVTVASCECQCPDNRPVFLPSRRQCVASLGALRILLIELF
jgi:hypothetical protein